MVIMLILNLVWINSLMGIINIWTPYNYKIILSFYNKNMSTRKGVTTDAERENWLNNKNANAQAIDGQIS